MLNIRYLNSKKLKTLEIIMLLPHRFHQIYWGLKYVLFHNKTYLLLTIRVIILISNHIVQLYIDAKGFKMELREIFNKYWN